MASTYLYRTCSSATDNKKFTLSFWVKRGNQANATSSDNDYLFHNISLSPSTQYSYVLFQRENTSELDRFIWRIHTGGSNVASFVTSAKFRDTAAWSHIVIKCDTSQAVSTDRVKIWINGVLETNWEESTYPSQNQDTLLLSLTGSGQVSGQGNFRIGAYPPSSNYFNGSMTHINATDGYAYDASTFGETDSTSGIWKPKTAPSVTYGTNGFFLKMENSGAMGTDSSGNGNNFTVSGTLTQNVDTPSNNFATLNPLDVGRWTVSNTFSNGNLTVTTNDYISANGSLAVSSGKFYWEVEYDTAGASNIYAGAGIINYDGWNGLGGGGSGANTYIYATSGQKVNNASGSAFGATLSAGDIVGIALDLDNGFLYFSKNGVWQNSGDPTSGATGTGNAFSSLSGTFTAHCNDPHDTQDHDYKFNFGQGYFGTTSVASAGTSPSEGGIFEYDCPSGYQALCTKGINSF